MVVGFFKWIFRFYKHNLMMFSSRSITVIHYIKGFFFIKGFYNI